LTSSKSDIERIRNIRSIKEVTTELVKSKLGDLQQLLENLKLAKIDMKNHVDANKSQMRKERPTLNYSTS